jgi:hypothetical protein
MRDSLRWGCNRATKPDQLRIFSVPLRFQLLGKPKFRFSHSKYIGPYAGQGQSQESDPVVR